MDRGVLVVDDEADLLESVVELLRLEGYAVEGVEDGGRALALLRAGHRPCLMLLDLMMPDVDGWTVVAEMKSTPEWANIPIVICTSAPARAPAGVPVLTKPVDIDDLLEVVAQHCRPAEHSSP